MTPNPAQQMTLSQILLLALLLSVVVLLTVLLRRTRQAEPARPVLEEGEPGAAAGLWRALGEEVERSDRLLTPLIFHKLHTLFLDRYASGGQSPAALTSEYAKEEFLLVVGPEGEAAATLPEMLDTFRQTTAAHAEFARWFRPAVIAQGALAGGQALLAARWLCHLLGLRHGTVEIFIDPPHLPGHTLVQVRGMEKFEAPGAFDIPCAGHISALDSPQVALEKELREELNVSLEDLDDLRLVGRYNSYTAADGKRGLGLKVNNEHRVLYRARLKAGAAERIRFTDGEVAALAVFSVEELRALVGRYPERIASGLSGAMDYYE